MCLRFDTIDTSAICHLFVPVGRDLFDTTHAMNCKNGGFVNARHDSICDFETSLLRKVCTEVILGRSANTSDEAHLDFRGCVFLALGAKCFL